LGWPGPRNILRKKETVLNSQPGEMPGLKTERIFLNFNFFVSLRWQIGYAAAHLSVSGLELAPGLLQSSGCMMKNRRNLADWARVPTTTQPAASLPETKD